MGNEKPLWHMTFAPRQTPRDEEPSGDRSHPAWPLAEGTMTGSKTPGVDEPSLEDLKAQVKDILGEFEKPNTFEPYKAVIETPMGAPTITVDWRLVDLARDLCRSAGHDPDLRVLDTQNVQRGPLGSTPVSMSVPAWTLYIEAAQNVRGALNG